MYVEIPAYEKVSGKHEKHSFTVFQIDVFCNERHHTVYKRYTEFDRLNTILVQNKIRVPTFPGKTVLKWSPKTLEYRRQVFEHYLNTILRRSVIPEEVIVFLKADQYHPESSTFVGGIDREFSRAASRIDQPVVAFPRDLRLSEGDRGSTSDIVVLGVLQAYYDHV